MKLSDVKNNLRLPYDRLSITSYGIITYIKINIIRIKTELKLKEEKG